MQLWRGKVPFPTVLAINQAGVRRMLFFKSHLFLAILHPMNGGTQALETFCIWLLTAFRPHGIIYVSGAMMKLRLFSLALVFTGVSGAAAVTQAPPEQLLDPNTAPPTKDSPRLGAAFTCDKWKRTRPAAANRIPKARPEESKEK